MRHETVPLKCAKKKDGAPWLKSQGTRKRGETRRGQSVAQSKTSDFLSRVCGSGCSCSCCMRRGSRRILAGSNRLERARKWGHAHAARLLTIKNQALFTWEKIRPTTHTTTSREIMSMGWGTVEKGQIYWRNWIELTVLFPSPIIHPELSSVAFLYLQCKTFFFFLPLFNLTGKIYVELFFWLSIWTKDINHQ